jgi:hypothetical protein
VSLVVAEGKNGRRYAWPPDAPEKVVPSVTTILKHVAKPHLVNAAGWEVARYATEHILRWSDLPPDDATSLLAGVARRVWNQKANLGTDVHKAVEAFLSGEAQPPRDGVVPYLAGAAAFMAERVHRIVHSEAVVYNLRYDYAGRVDAIAKMDDGDLAVIDWKSGRVNTEMALQINGYAHGEFVGRPDGTTVTLPPITQGWIVQLPGDGTYEATPVPITDRAFKTFLAYRTIQKWADDHEDEALGEPVTGGQDNATTTPQGGN